MTKSPILLNRLDMKVKLFSISLLILFVNPYTFFYAQNDYLSQKWEYVGLNYYIGLNNMLSVDIDNNGKEEILLDFNDGKYLAIIEFVDGDYQYKWVYQNINDPIKDFTIMDFNSDSVKDIAIIHLYSGMIEIFDGISFQRIVSYETNLTNAFSLNVVDFDSDGIVEIVVANNKYWNGTSLSILEYGTFETKWDTTFTEEGIFDIEVGEVDNDGNIEIILSSGLIIDGIDHTIDWDYQNGFGGKIELGDIDNDGLLEIISLANYYDINVFNAEFKTPLWSITSEEDLSSLNIYKNLTTNETEIVVGDGQWGNIKSYSPTTKEILWKIKNPNHGTTNITIGDPDNDGESEVLWGAGAGTSGPDNLYIASIKNKYIEWTSKNHIQPYNIDIFDSDNDGEKEIIVGCSKDEDSEYDATIFSINSLTHQTELYKSYDTYIPNTLLVTRKNPLGTCQIFTTAYTKLFVINGESFNLERTELIRNSNSEILSLAYDDIDNDGIQEIVAGNQSGYIFILNGNTFEEEWHSIRTTGAIKKIKLINCDDDEALEIIFLKYNNGIEIYDGKTHFLEHQSEYLYGINDFDIADMNLDGKLEIITNDNNGKLYLLDIENLNSIDTLDLKVEEMVGIKIANLDMDPSKEIIAGSSKLQIFGYDDLSLKYESNVLGYSTGYKNNIKVIDLDGDNYLDIFISNDEGIFHFECNELSPDILPPTVFSTYPYNNDESIGLNEKISIIFSENISQTSIADSNFTIIVNDSLVISKTLDYNSNTGTLTINPNQQFPANSKIKVICSGNIIDESMNGLDGNFNELSEYSPLDNFIFSFTSGSSIDTTGPFIENLNVDRNETWPGFKISISGTISDFSDFAISRIGFVECFIDSIKKDSTGIKVYPEDELFNSSIENFYIDFKTHNWSLGEHKIFLIGYDNVGNKSEILEIPILIKSKDIKDANWTMLGYNAQNTRFNSNDSIVVPLKLKWSKKVFDNLVNQAIVVDDKIFVTESKYQSSSKIYALYVDNGDTCWTYNIYYCNYVKLPAYQNGRLYIPIETNPHGGSLIAIDAVNGKFLWERYRQSKYYDFGPSPIIAENRILTAGEYGNLLVLDAMKDSLIWSATNNKIQFNWNPAYYEGKVYTCGSGISYRAYDLTTGEIEQEMGTEPFTCTPVISDGILFTQNPIAAINLSTNKALWSVSGSFPPAIAYKMVFSVSNDSLYVNDFLNGQLLWTKKINYKINNPPIISNGYVFLSSDNNIVAINIETRSKVWEYKVGGRITIANNNLFLATNDGRVICFEEDETVDIVQNSSIPSFYSLNQNYPNPFNPNTTIEYSIPKQSLVKIIVYDVLGKEISTLVNEVKQAGNYETNFNGISLPSGVYFYQMKAGNFNEIKKFILLK